jgi:radical SAM superfamily enzyme YgiQ (UPF0313 family)
MEIIRKSEKNLVIFIDPIKGERSEGETEIHIPDRKMYIGSPVAIREPIALEYIASYLEKYGFKTLVILQAFINDEEILSIIKENKDDLIAVCFGLHSTFLIPNTLKLAKKIKSEFPKIPIIVGGYHPTGDPSFVSETPIDYAVVGEGEATCLELIESIKNNINPQKIQKIKGISYVNKKGNVIENPRRKRLNFSDISFPKRDNKILSLCHPGPLSYPPVGKVAQIAISRGCSHHCSFCASPKMWEGKIIYRDPKDVVKEMKYLITKFGVNNFFFCDLSFNSNKKKLIEFLDGVKNMKHEVKTDFGSHVMCTTIKMDSELLQKMKDANFMKIDYGLEDILNVTLRKIKSFQTFDYMKKILKLTNDHGILIRGLMMIGYPWETIETMEERRRLIEQLPIDQLRCCFYVPFPGAKIYNELKDRIIVGPEGFTTDIPAIKCDGISSEDLLKGVKDIMKTYYNSDNYIKLIKKKSKDFPELKNSYIRYIKYLKIKNVIENKYYYKLIQLVNT